MKEQVPSIQNDPELLLECDPTEFKAYSGAYRTGTQWMHSKVFTIKSFICFSGPSDYWYGFRSILYITLASLVFGRLPKLPFAVIVFIPFVYLSLLGAAMHILGNLYAGLLNRKNKDSMLLKVVSHTSCVPIQLSIQGSRMLRASFTVSVYLVLGLLYYALFSSNSPEAWLLLPCALFCMVLIFSYDQQMTGQTKQVEKKYSLKRTLLKRGCTIILLILSIFLLYKFLMVPFLSILTS